MHIKKKGIEPLHIARMCRSEYSHPLLVQYESAQLWEEGGLVESYASVWTRGPKEASAAIRRNSGPKGRSESESFSLPRG